MPSTGETYITVEVICTRGCSLTRRGSWVGSMRSACGLASQHYSRTGHAAFARLTQETGYGTDAAQLGNDATAGQV